MVYSVLPLLLQLIQLALSFWFNYELHRNFEKPLELQECLDAIKEHAFTPTRSYPVIITIKDSLKPDLQSKVTQVYNVLFLLVFLIITYSNSFWYDILLHM